MAAADDLSAQHFEWLVTNRSRNQHSTLELYKIIDAHEAILSRNTILQAYAQHLLAVAFSLWRAVFLSDLSGNAGNQLTDAKKFLQSLIAHNTVLYQTDFNARDWSFEYYMGNARFRLEELHRTLDGSKESGLVARTAKDDWVIAQSRLERYTSLFAVLVKNEDRSVS